MITYDSFNPREHVIIVYQHLFTKMIKLSHSYMKKHRNFYTFIVTLQPQLNEYIAKKQKEKIAKCTGVNPNITNF